MTTESDKPRPRLRAAPMIVTVLMIVFVLYPLSIGPAIVVCIRANVPEKSFLTVYSPIFWFAKKTRTEDAVRVYAMWWLSVTGTPMPG